MRRQSKINEFVKHIIEIIGSGLAPSSQTVQSLLRPPG